MCRSPLSLALSRSQLRGTDGPIEFKIVRDAGTFTCQGRGGQGRAAGTFDFAPSSAFPAAMAQRGLERPSAEQQFQLALYDIGYVFVNEIKAQGYRPPSMDDLIEAGQHGVDLEFVKGLSTSRLSPWCNGAPRRAPGSRSRPSLHSRASRGGIYEAQRPPPGRATGSRRGLTLHQRVEPCWIRGRLDRRSPRRARP